MSRSSTGASHAWAGNRMPEGDTVFRAAYRLREALAGKALTQGEVRHPRLSTIDMSEWRVTDVLAIGKHILLRFDNDRSLHSHLRMDGAWHVYRHGDRWRGPAHRIRVVLRSRDRVAVGFRLHDLRILRQRDEHRVVGQLGPDLLSETWDAASVDEVIRRMPEQARLGTVLLDQRVVAGIGNVYIAEICFLAGLSPSSPVSALDTSTRRRVLDVARCLLWNNRYNTVRTTTGDTRAGRRHWVYQRDGFPCPHCGTPIQRARLGTPPRDTWFCPRCQPGVTRD